MLWFGAFPAWFRNVTYWQVNPFTWLDCKFIVPFRNFAAHWSSSLLVIMCAEKFFALYFPLKTRSICNVKMAKRVTLVATILLAGYDSQNFFIWKPFVYLGEKHCWLTNAPLSYYPVFTTIDSALYSFAPFTIMGIANCAIVYKFMRAACQSGAGGTESTNQALSKSASKGTAMLITVSLVFLILTGPIAIYLTITTDLDPMAQTITVLMRYVNYAINAVLYCMSGSRFRGELIKIFPFSLCRKKRELNQSSRTYSSSFVNSTSATEVNTTASPI